jgi:predicted nucleic acid-binding protein
MKLVVDANILIAAFLKDSTTRRLLLREDINFFAPEHLLNEIKHLLKNPKVRKRIKVSDDDLKELTSAMFSQIKFIPEKMFFDFIKNSISLVTHPEDAPYIGLSLALKVPLWSNDSELKKQSHVLVLTTTELLQFIG